MNERVRMACASSCADFVYGFMESSSKKGNEYWLIWRYEGESTLADLMTSKDFPYNIGTWNPWRWLWTMKTGHWFRYSFLPLTLHMELQVLSKRKVQTVVKASSRVDKFSKSDIIVSPSMVNLFILQTVFVMIPKEFAKAGNAGDDVFFCEYEYDIRWHSFKRLAEINDVEEDDDNDDDDSASDEDWKSTKDPESESEEDMDFEDENDKRKSFGRNAWYGQMLAKGGLSIDMGDSISGKGMIQRNGRDHYNYKRCYK